MIKAAILDDYQNISKEFIELKKFKGKYEIKVFSEPFKNEEETIENLKDYEALLIMRERTPITKNLIINGRKNKILNKKIDTKIPVVLFHGLKDESVPLKFSKKILQLFKTRNKKIIKIKDGDHSLSRKKDLKMICSELKRLIANTI